MNPALQKTVAFLFLIALGLLLRNKLASKEQLGGLKVIILSVALPAMIFVALLNIQIEAQLFYLPVLALAFNLVMVVLTFYMLPIFGIKKGSPTNRTLTMLLPSLAPGLSCFPYLLEYLGEEMFAWAALADVGNKIFVLIILYMLAMHWYYQNQKSDSTTSNNQRLKELGSSLIKEPVNLVIITALLMLSVGLNYTSLPLFMQDAVSRLSAMMTPLVLLFIGLAVRVNKSQLHTITGLLLWRSGIAFGMSALLIALLPEATPAAVLLLAVAFPQSSASFWPFAHISAIGTVEDKDEIPKKQQTFDRDLALAVLAFSLPFSTMTILLVCSVGNFFTAPLNLIAVGAVLLGSGSLVFVLKKLKKKSAVDSEEEKMMAVEEA